MEKPEFTALQVTVFIRTRPGESQPVQTFLNSVAFESQIQENLSNLIAQSLKTAGLSFDEIIIDLQTPAAKAQATGQAEKKASPLARLFGKG